MNSSLIAKRLIAALGIFALQGCATLPQSDAAVAVAFPQEVAASPPERGPALWRVADEDTTIYLFGTIHALPEDVDWYSGPVKIALDSSTSLVTEIDMTPEALAGAAGTISARGRLPAGKSLRGLMNSQQLAAYQAGLAKLGIPPGAFDAYDPWYAAITITQIIVQSAGYDNANGVEKVLEATVKPGTRRVALETIDHQIAIFDELPIENQLVFLLGSVEDPQGAAETLDRIVDEWAKGDLETLGTLLQHSSTNDPLVASRLFYERNASWAVWIDDRLDTPGTAFVAVGAGHLTGAKSVQDYLGQRGIAVTRLQ